MRNSFRAFAILLLFCCLRAQAEDNFIPPRVVYDAQRQVMWALRDGYIMRYDAQRRVLLDTFSLADFSYAIKSETCAPDMVLDENGNLIISSNVDRPLWRIDAQSLKVEEIDLALDTDKTKDIGFTGLFIAAPGVLLGVSAIHGSFWKIDLASHTAQKLALARPIRGACAIGLAGGHGGPLPPPEDRGRMTLCAQGRRASYTIRLTGMRLAELLDAPCAQAGKFHGRPMG